MRTLCQFKDLWTAQAGILAVLRFLFNLIIFLLELRVATKILK